MNMVSRVHAFVALGCAAIRNRPCATGAIPSMPVTATIVRYQMWVETMTRHNVPATCHGTETPTQQRLKSLNGFALWYYKVLGV